jgi:hypothetical protein
MAGQGSRASRELQTRLWRRESVTYSVRLRSRSRTVPQTFCLALWREADALHERRVSCVRAKIVEDGIVAQSC